MCLTALPCSGKCMNANFVVIWPGRKHVTKIKLMTIPIHMIARFCMLFTIWVNNAWRSPYITNHFCRAYATPTLVPPTSPANSQTSLMSFSTEGIRNTKLHRLCYVKKCMFCETVFPTGSFSVWMAAAIPSSPITTTKLSHVTNWQAITNPMTFASTFSGLLRKR